jgi:hypothetical protein
VGWVSTRGRAAGLLVALAADVRRAAIRPIRLLS